MQFHKFPFDSHRVEIVLFFPKKHKDRIYEFVSDPSTHIASERITPDSAGGKASSRCLHSAAPRAHTRLCWTNLRAQ